MTPLERVARAICEARGHPPDAVDPLDLSHKRLAMWRRYVPAAGAAIDAVRDALDESGMVEGARQMAEIDGSDAATRASLVYDYVIAWLDNEG